MKFELTDKQIEKFRQWRKDLEQRMLASDPGLDHLGIGSVYYGAAGGGYTFSFTPTGLGDCVSVQEAFSKEELNLTDYDTW